MRKHSPIRLQWLEQRNNVSKPGKLELTVTVVLGRGRARWYCRNHDYHHYERQALL